MSRWSVPPAPGLCQSCAAVKRIESAKGSVFWMCTRHAADPRFPKYPPQPVRACSGWTRATSAGGLDADRPDSRFGRE